MSTPHENGLAGKRILYVITKSNWGGAQAYVFNLAKYFHDAGAEVSVALGSASGAAGSETGPLAKRLGAAGIRTIPLSVGRNVSLPQELRALRQLIKVIRAERPDVLHLNSSKAGGIGALAGRIAGVPRIVFTVHGWSHREPWSLPMRVFVRISSWLTILLAHQVIAVSRCDYETAPVLFSRKKVELIHNGLASFAVLPRVAARKELIGRAPGLLDTVPWLLMLAELHPNKGVDTAIRALACLTDFPDAALVVLGEGTERAALLRLAQERGVADRVFLLGFVSEARSFLSAADLVLMPSRKEGLPTAILEAGHAQRAVVASSVGGIPEIITHAQNGVLVAADDPEALAHAAESLLNTPATAATYGTRLQETVTSRFSAEAMLAETAAVYTS